MTINIDVVKHIVDGMAAINVGAVLIALLPPLAALLTLLWTAMRMYEMISGLPFHQTPFMVWLKGKQCK